MSKKPKTHQKGRDSKNGRFTTVKKTKDSPGTKVVERVLRPRRGRDAKKSIVPIGNGGPRKK